MEVRRNGLLIGRFDWLAQLVRFVRQVTVRVDTGNVLVPVALSAAAVVAQHQAGTNRAVVLNKRGGSREINKRSIN